MGTLFNDGLAQISPNRNVTALCCLTGDFHRVLYGLGSSSSSVCSHTLKACLPCGLSLLPGSWKVSILAINCSSCNSRSGSFKNCPSLFSQNTINELGSRANYLMRSFFQLLCLKKGSNASVKRSRHTTVPGIKYIVRWTICLIMSSMPPMMRKLSAITK